MARARTELIHCENCGEDYADTYRRCPFCNAKSGQKAEPAYDDYDDAPRRGGKRLADGRDEADGTAARIAIYVLVTVAVLALVLFVASLLIPKLMAPAPSAAPSPTEEVLPSPTSAPLPSAPASEAPEQFEDLPAMDGMPAVTDDPLALDSPDLPGVEDGPVASAAPVATPAPAAIPAPAASAAPAASGSLTLNRDDISISAAYPDPVRLRVTGGEAVSWTSSRESVATVSDNGTVTAVGNGTATITATSPSGDTASCVVRVSGKGAAGTGQTAAPTPDGAAAASGAKLSSTDFSISAAYPDPVRLRVIGGEAAGWTSNRESVATVSDNGTVTAVGNGIAKVTCTLTDGSTLTCDVHVTGK